MPVTVCRRHQNRKINADQIAALAAKTSPTRPWKGPFVQLGNSQVEASFADHRTYVYKGKDVDQFRQEGRQVIIGPASLKTGEIIPFDQARK